MVILVISKTFVIKRLYSYSPWLQRYLDNLSKRSI